MVLFVCFVYFSLILSYCLDISEKKILAVVGAEKPVIVLELAAGWY